MYREKEGRDGILEKEGKEEEYPARRESYPEHRHRCPPEAVPAGSEVTGDQSPGSRPECRWVFRDRGIRHVDGHGVGVWALIS